MVMLALMLILKTFLPIGGSKIYSIIMITIYTLFGGSIYLFLTYKMNVFGEIFECNPKELIKKKLKK